MTKATNTHSAPERAIGFVVLSGFAFLIFMIGIDSRNLQVVRKQIEQQARADSMRRIVEDEVRRATSSRSQYNNLPPATQEIKDACAREASGGFNYSASEIAQYANDIPDIAVAYGGCVMRRRQAGN